MNINEFNQAAAERVIKSLRDRGAEVNGRVIVKTLTGMKPENSGQLHEDQPYEITSWATKSNVDMEGEVVLPNGGDVTSYFSKNRTLFVDHEYDIMKAVGKCRWLKMTPKGWLIKSALINNLDNPYRKQVQALADSGNIGMSVGMEIVDSGPPMVDERKSYGNARNIIRKWKLLEVSYTAMPMNGDCQSDLVQESEPQMSIETKNAKKIFILGQDMVVRIKELRSKNCGTGAGGFKPGNTCAAEDGSNQGMRQESGKKPKVGTNQEYQQISDRKDRVLERLYDVGKTGSDQQKEALISKLESFSSENLKPINKLEGSIDRRVNRAIDHVMRGIMDEFEGSLGVDKERKPILRHTDGINVLLDSLEQHLGKTKMYVWSKDCGTGAGGFKPGNTCAAGDGSETPKPSGKKPKTKLEDFFDDALIGTSDDEVEMQGKEGVVSILRTSTSRSRGGKPLIRIRNEPNGGESRETIVSAADLSDPKKQDFINAVSSEIASSLYGSEGAGTISRSDQSNEIRDYLKELINLGSTKKYFSAKDCGTGAGGFKPGNTCAAGEGSGSDEQLSERYTESEKQEISKMSELSSSDKMKVRDLQEIGKEVKSNYEFIDRQLLLVGGKPSKTAVADVNFRLAKTIAKIDGSSSANVINEARARVGKTTDPLQAAMLVTDDLNGQLRQKVKPFQRWDSKSDVSVSDQLKEAIRVNNIMKSEWDFRKSKKPKMYIFMKDCGTGAGGFKPGNTCAAGDGSNQERGRGSRATTEGPKRPGRSRSITLEGVNGDVVVSPTNDGVSVSSAGETIDLTKDEIFGMLESDPNYGDKYSRLGSIVFGGEAADTDMVQLLRQMRSVSQKMYFNWKDCGTGAGGFKPGNTCAAGGAGKLSETRNNVQDQELMMAREEGKKTFEHLDNVLDDAEEYMKSKSSLNKIQTLNGGLSRIADRLMPGQNTEQKLFAQRETMKKDSLENLIKWEAQQARSLSQQIKEGLKRTELADPNKYAQRINELKIAVSPFENM